MKRLLSMMFSVAWGVALAGFAQAQTAAPKGPDGLKDPIELCGKLAGTEREICLRKAREQPTGDGARSQGDKRANTPPGKSRAGDAPADGAIVDPAGVTRR